MVPGELDIERKEPCGPEHFWGVTRGGLSGPAAPSPDSWAGEKAMAMRADPPLLSKYASSIWLNELCLLINGSYLARVVLNCQDFKLT